MHRREKEGVAWLEFELFAGIKAMKHRLYLRSGGFSSGPFESLNFSYQVGDAPENVRRNIDKVKKELQIDHLVRAKLSHGNDIVAIDETMQLSNSSFDAMVTNRKEIALLVTHADCQAAILYDPINHAVANVHCGWRGNVQNIYQKSVETMSSLYGSKPQNLLAAVSPSLGPDNAQFLHYEKELPKQFWEYQVKPFHFDLWAIADMQLQEAGLLPHHIEIAKICTFSEKEDFFSYRREKICGRHATIVSLH